MAQNIPMSSHKDIYFGIEKVDNFRNFENLNDSLVLNWIQSKTKDTKDLLLSFEGRDLLINKIKKSYTNKNYHFGKIVYANINEIFYVKIDLKDNIHKLYQFNNILNKETLIFDCSKISPNHQIKYISINNRGSLIAFAISEKGKELSEIYFYNIKNQKILDKVIDNNWVSSIGGIKWSDDDMGIYFTKLQSKDITNKDFLFNNKAVYSNIYESDNNFKVVFSKGSKNVLDTELSDFFTIEKVLKKHIIAKLGGANKFKTYYFSKKHRNNNETFTWHKLFDKNDSIKDIIFDNNNIYYLKEIKEESIIFRTNFKNQNFKNNKDIIVKLPSSETITGIYCHENLKIFTTVKNGVQAFLYQFDESGIINIELPFNTGNIEEIVPIKNSDNIILDLTGWFHPYTRFIYNLKTKKFSRENIEENTILEGIENLVSQEIEIKTHDGLDMPISILYHKDMIKNNKNRTIITAYGAYGVIQKPSFNLIDLLWVLDGGIYVTAHVRGGGAKGTSWHKGGFKATKPNSWKDVISATEYLISNGYTSPKFIGLTGTSAGGLTIANAALERPELYKAVNVEHARLNMLRSETDSNGVNNAKEFGSIFNEEEFPHILNMDAFHKIKSNIKYPTWFVYSGLHDARVPAWHSAKFVAQLDINGHEVLYECNFDKGHFGPNSVSSYLFFNWQLGHPDYQLKAD